MRVRSSGGTCKYSLERLNTHEARIVVVMVVYVRGADPLVCLS